MNEEPQEEIENETEEDNSTCGGIIAGVIFMLVGIGAFIYFAFVFDITVQTDSGDSVVNVGLQSEQLTGVIAGATFFLAGLVMLTANMILNAIRSSRSKPSKPGFIKKAMEL